MASIIHWTTQMTSKDKLFYQQMGQRIALFRRAQDLTQQQPRRNRSKNIDFSINI